MKALWRLFLTFSRFKQIGICVFLLHGLILLLLTSQYFLKRKPIPNQRITVRTIAPPSPKPLSKAAAVPVAPKKGRPAEKKTAAVPKKKPAPSNKEQNLLEEIARNLETLTTPPSKARPDLTVPAQMEIEAEVESDSATDETLVGFLQSALELPEYGEVIAKIEIASSGNLLSCEILEARSKKNGEFLKKRLPELHFPCFNENKTFTITFRNVEHL